MSRVVIIVVHFDQNSVLYSVSYLNVMDNFDKEAFIDEVEKRPVIWDTDCPEYSDRILKKKAWEELTEIFADPNYSKEKKTMFNLQIQRKWKNLRDTYLKEYKKIKANSSFGASKGSNYIYYARLSFLQKCLKNKSMISSNDSKDIDVDDLAKANILLDSMNYNLSEIMETASNKSSTSPISSESNYRSTPVVGAWSMFDHSRSTSFLDSLPSVFGSYKHNSKQKDDDDKLFCLSLYKEIRKVPEHNRLEVKIELLRVLRTAQMLSLNETQKYHSDEKPNASSSWTSEYLKRMESKERVREELLSRIKPLKLSFDPLKGGVDHSLSAKRNDRLRKILRFVPSSSDSSLSSDGSTFNDTKMEVA